MIDQRALLQSIYRALVTAYRLIKALLVRVLPAQFLLWPYWRRTPPTANTIRHTTLEPADDSVSIFNPTLIKNGDNICAIARIVDRHDQLRRLALIPDISPRIDGRLSTRDCLPIEFSEQIWAADPRAHTDGARTYLTFNSGRSESPNRILYCELPAKLAQTEGLQLTAKAIEAAFPRRQIEKNWGLFFVDDREFAVYTYSPEFAVIEIEKGPNNIMAELVIKHSCILNAWEAKYGQVRGGAPPIQYRGQMLAVTQSRVTSRFGLIYHASLFVFEASYPFRPLRISQSPFITVTERTASIRQHPALAPHTLAAIYPCGCIIDHERDLLHLSYGINDHGLGISSYSISRLLNTTIAI